MRKLLLIFAALIPLQSFAEWQGTAIQKTVVDFDRYVDDRTEAVQMCRMIIGSRSDENKPVIVVESGVGNKQQLHFRSSVDRIDGNQFSLSIDGRAPYEFSAAKASGMNADEFFQDLANAKKKRYGSKLKPAYRARSLLIAIC